MIRRCADPLSRRSRPLTRRESAWDRRGSGVARPGGIQALAAEAVARLAAGDWRPLVTRFPLADAPEAHRALVERRTTGKVVLIP